jgi:hypothetical protein
VSPCRYRDTGRWVRPCVLGVTSVEQRGGSTAGEAPGPIHFAYPLKDEACSRRVVVATRMRGTPGSSRELVQNIPRRPLMISAGARH